MTPLRLRPRISAYPLAALSISLATALAISGYLMLHEFSRLRNRDLLASTLRVGTTEEQDLMISRLFQIHPWIASAARAVGSSDLLFDQRAVASELAVLHRTLRSNQAGLAVRHYEKSTALLTLQQQAEESSALRRLSEHFQELARLLQDLERGLVKEADASNRMNNTQKRHQILSEDLAIFLGLPPTIAGNDGYYMSGLLAELPTLQGLPDGLESATTLKQLLESQGALPKLEQGNQQDLFNKKVETLRNSSRELRLERSSVERELQVINAQLAGQRAALDASGKRASLTTEAILESLIPRSPLFQD